MGPSFDVELELNRHGAALRALAGELIADHHAAEDAVQQVWLDALQRPPRHDGAVGGWLATALRNVIGGWRRSGRRRARREDEVVAARGDAADDHAVALAREELAERLLAAVRSLEPAHRDAIWQRYFQGKAPRDIAAAAGVPVETVKTRQKRALAALRERLGEREGREWRAGFAAAFGFGRRETMTATAAIAGGLVMATWTKVTAAAAAVAAAVLAIACWPDPNTAPPLQATETGVASMATSGEAAAPSPDAVPAAAERVAAPANDTKHATIRGRCVDENGAPLAGCSVALHGRFARSWNSDAWLVEHGDAPISIERTSAADGAFEFRFAPWPPYAYTVGFQRADRAHDHKWFESIAAGALHDVGDVVLRPGVILRGRVVDGSGLPVSELAIGPARDANSWSEFTHTAADGSFALETALPFGTCALRVEDGWSVTSPVPLVLDAGTPPELRVVVDRPDVPAITGFVVDETDQPVGWAQVTWSAGGAAPVDGVRSKRNGSFELRNTSGGATLPVTLLAGAQGCETSVPLRDVAWGARDVRLRVVRSPALTVAVTDAHGKPIEGCCVRITRAGRGGWASGDVYRRRTDADGIAVQRGLPRGSWYVVAQFRSALRALPVIERVEFDDSPMRVDVRAGTEATRRVRVVTADGTPVAGTHVQVCEMLGSSFSDRTVVLAEGQWWNPVPQCALVLTQGVTAADGTFTLRGPAGRSVGVRVLGPGHVVVEYSDVLLGTEADLVVTVVRGGRLRGRIEPPEAVDELRRLASAASDERVRGRTRVRLWNDTVPRPGLPGIFAGMQESSPEVARFDVRPDGTFDVSGLPAGVWRVGLEYHVQTGRSGGNRFADGGACELHDGSTAEVRVDLTHLLPGTIRGTVLQNGQPLADKSVALESTYGVGADGSEVRECVFIETDSEGRFELTTRPGRYSLRHAAVRDTYAWPLVDLARGAVASVTFELAVGRLEVRLLAPDGRPAARVALYTDPLTGLAMTDTDGCATVHAAPGPLPLRVLRRRLQSAHALDELRIVTGAERPSTEHWFDLGTATITSGATTTLELRLPPEWEK